MKLVTLGLAGLFGWSACGKEIIVGDGSGGRSGAGAPGTAGRTSAFENAGGGAGGVVAGGNNRAGAANIAGATPTAGAPSLGNSAGAAPAGGGAPGAGTAGTAGLPSSVPLTPTNGWVSSDNPLQSRGWLSAVGDDVTRMSMTSDFNGSNACIAGTAARVEDPCTITAPARDCFDVFFGAHIGLTLNQSFNGEPLPFDASALKGFSFEVTGNTVPGPKDLRFAVATADRDFCNLPTTKIKVGANVLLFSDLAAECWHITDPPNPTAETVQSALVELKWSVVTNTSARVPFDFCISNIRALPK